MRRFAAIILLLVGSIIWAPTIYASSPTGDLVIIEFKPTSSESVVLYNNTGSAVNLQNYLLQYFNKSSPSNFNVPTTSQQLPNFNLQAGQAFLLTGDSIGTCGASGVANLSISLSDTSGYLQTVKSSGSGGNVLFSVQDKVSWTSTSSGADIVSVPSATSDANAVWFRKLSDSTWSKYAIDTTSCNLFVTVTTSSTPTYIDWANGAEAPSQIVIADSSVSSIPDADKGLATPQITEALPNPAPPQSDDEDEFIELYNPNDVAFDLSGFKLQVGLTSLHTYTLPAGTNLPAKSFKAFYSVDTNLSMSNSSGQAKLVDPLGNVISQTDQYSSAKEGYSWSLSAGSWYWTDNSTPDKSNLIKLVSAAKTTSNKTASSVNSTGSSTGLVNGASTSTAATGSAQPPKVHSWTIAVMGGLAILYALYEYRNDLANHLYKLRRDGAIWRAVSWPSGIATTNRIKSRFGRWQNHVSKRHSPRSKKSKPRK